MLAPRKLVNRKKKKKVNNVEHLIETESLRCMISYENELTVAY
jgi:hypothetical protein